MHTMYPDGGRKLARTGMRNKLFHLHGLILIEVKILISEPQLPLMIMDEHLQVWKQLNQWFPTWGPQEEK